MWVLLAVAAVVAWLYTKGSQAAPASSPSGASASGGGSSAGDYPLTTAPTLPDLGPSPDWVDSYNPANDSNAAGIEPVLGPVRPF